MGETGDQPGKRVLLGKVTKPHGIRGEVKVFAFSGEPENFANYRELFIGQQGNAKLRPYRVLQARVQGNTAILKLKGCVSRSDAEALANHEVWINSCELPELDPGEIYLHQLEGITAVSEDGEDLGRVSAILDTGGHEVLAIRNGESEFLVPLVSEFIVRLEKDQVVLSLPPGLLEIND